MTTELDRLEAWMAANGHDSHSLAMALGYKNDWIARMLMGLRPVRHAFQARFAATFGSDEFVAVFGANIQHIGVPMNARPEQTMGQIAVNNAIVNGQLPRATALKCCVCDNQARHYHHPSLHLNDLLNVVPVCSSCHRRIHKSGLQLPPLGVVPTQVGLVRASPSHPPNIRVAITARKGAA